MAAKSSRKKPESATVARPTAVALTEIAVESSVGIETEEANLADATLPAVMKPVVVRRPAKRGRYEIIKEVAEDGRSTITRIFTEADIPAIPSVKKLPPKINSQALSSRVSAIDEVKTKLTRKKRRKGPPTAQAIDASANVQAKPLGRPKGTPSLAVNIDGLTSGALFDHPNGCSQYISGEGVIHTRSVNTAAPVFMRENPNRELRKALLRRDLTAIREAVVNLNAELLRHRASTTEEESLDHDRIDDFSGEQA